MGARPELRRLTVFLTAAAPLFGLIVAVVSTLIMRQALTVPMLMVELWAWVTLAATVPIIIALAERRAQIRESRPRMVAVHLVTFVVMILVHTAAYNALLILMNHSASVRWLQQVFVFARYDALLYPLIVAAVSMTRQRRVTRRSELAAARLARRVAEAEVEHVRVRLDPDEVLADLCDVEGRVTHDPDGAERRVHEISRSLRAKLERIATGPLSRRPHRKRHISTGGDVRRMVFLISSVFGLYIATTMLVWRWIAGANTRRDLLGTVVAFTVAGLYAAAAIPLFRRAMAWRQQAPLRRGLGVLFVALFCAIPAVLVELLMAALRPLKLGRPLGSTFDFVLILSFVSLYIVAVDDLKAQQRESRLASERLGTALAEARLRSLRTQIAPHFVFNALNSILSLLRQDPAGARQMLRRLRSLLRATTAHRNRQEVTLGEDLEMTRSYLEIEQVRFRDAIDVVVEVDERLREAYVPAFLLQPLVENAIRHGALASLGRGTVRVVVSGTGDSLSITVHNDGELLDPSGWQDGIGLSNIRARLAQLYGPRHELAIRVDEETGVSVGVKLPLRVRSEVERQALAS